MDKKQVKTVLAGDFSGIDNFVENIINPIFGEDSFEKKEYAEELVTIEKKSVADFANVLSVINVGTICNYKSEDIELFDVTLKNNSEIARSRVGIQKLIRSMLSQYSHAFMIFHYKDVQNKEWRFSYLHKENSQKNTTSAKRFTYVFGREHNPRTATDRFEILSLSEKNDKDLLNAFSVEALSDEFFEKYEGHYNRFVNYLIDNPSMQKSFKKVILQQEEDVDNDVPETYKAKYKPLRDYVKKMMGRLVFLYFIERKGWLAGNKSYLSELYNNSSYKSDFLDKVLEPLFFGVLNTPHSMRKKFFEENGWDTKMIPDISKIPYLNGGLFEQDELDKCQSRFPQEYFDDLFAFFGEYNFTVDENDPNDEEMGIDPEMLSKIFESLLEDNKNKGAYYTHKNVVQDMCRDALIFYLAEKTSISEKILRQFIENTDNEELPEEIQKNKGSIIRYLQNVKICDPAIGSGAFPMGMLNILVKVRLALCPLKNKDSNEIVELKKSIIQNNIYGVDIEKGAIDIARLRFWLSIVVDSKADYLHAEPLPNFDYKFMQGNSLIPTFDGNYVELSVHNSKTAAGERYSAGVIVKNRLQQLSELRREYFNLFGKDKYRKEIEIKDLYLDTLKAIFEADLTSVKNRCPDGDNDFFNVTNVKIANEIKLNKERQKELKGILSKINFLRNEINNGSSSLEDRAKTDIRFFDYSLCFSEVMDRGGFDIVIGNPPYVSGERQLKSSQLIEQRNNIIGCNLYKALYQKWDLYIAFIELGIRHLCTENGICSMIVPFPLTNQVYGLKLRDMLLTEFSLVNIVNGKGKKLFKNAVVENCIVFAKKQIASKQGSTWVSNIGDDLKIHSRFSKPYSDLVQDEKTKVWNLTTEKREGNKHAEMHVLGDFCYISYGLRPNSDEKKARGEFKKEDLISDVKDDVPRRKYIEAKDIEKYCIKKIRYLEYGTERSPAKLTRPTFTELYNCPKLVFNILGALTGTYDSQNLVHNHSLIACVLWESIQGVENKSISASIKKFSTMKRKDMESLSHNTSLFYLLGIMNSTYANVLLANIRGDDYHIYPEHIRNIPIPNASNEKQDEIAVLVKNILEKKKKKEDTIELEKSLDKKVYSLYGVSD